MNTNKGVGGIYPHREIKNKIYSTLNQLHDELDKSYDLKKELSFDTQFVELLTNETRIKILKEFISLFKLLKNKNNENVPERLYHLSKRIKIHFSQLKKLKTKNYKDNIIYFVSLSRVVLMLSSTLR